jgi:hypothetical protein
VLATLPTATNDQPLISVTNLVILIIVAAVFYPLQKKIRDTVSRRRRERWAEEEGATEHDLDDRDRPSGDSQP